MRYCSYNLKNSRKKKNQKGLSYAIIKFTDLGGVFELFLFSDIFEQNREILLEGNSFFLNVIKNVSSDGNTSRINVRSISRIKDLVNNKIKLIEINSNSVDNLIKIKELISIPGETDVILNISENQIKHHYKLNEKRKIDQKVISQLKIVGVSLKIS